MTVNVFESNLDTIFTSVAFLQQRYGSSFTSGNLSEPFVSNIEANGVLQGILFNDMEKTKSFLLSLRPYLHNRGRLKHEGCFIL